MRSVMFSSFICALLATTTGADPVSQPPPQAIHQASTRPAFALAVSPRRPVLGGRLVITSNQLAAQVNEITYDDLALVSHTRLQERCVGHGTCRMVTQAVEPQAGQFEVRRIAGLYRINVPIPNLALGRHNIDFWHVSGSERTKLGGLTITVHKPSSIGPLSARLSACGGSEAQNPIFIAARGIMETTAVIANGTRLDQLDRDVGELSFVPNDALRKRLGVDRVRRRGRAETTTVTIRPGVLRLTDERGTWSVKTLTIEHCADPVPQVGAQPQ